MPAATARVDSKDDHRSRACLFSWGSQGKQLNFDSKAVLSPDSVHVPWEAR